MKLQLEAIDWAILIAYFGASLGIALYFTKRAGSSASEFFTSGGQVGWFMAGTSMVATTFAADTPLAVTSIVAGNGIAGNWLWWNMLFGGMLTAFFFARLWKRSGMSTDVELTEFRYAGRPAAFLRGFRAVYLAIPFNCLVVGWVNRAMVDILTIFFFPGQAGGDGAASATTQIGLVLACYVVVGGYSLLSGLWGVIFTDAFQFILAMAGCIALAFITVGEAGGMAAIQAKLPAATFDLLPAADSPWMPRWCFLTLLFVPWWSAWYPGSEPGGGAYVAQRMFASKDERNSVFAVLWFYVAHFALRPWPWILAALAGMVLFPEMLAPGQNAGHIYPMMIVKYMPAGLRGLLLTAFLAAYMSTISTQLNWGASYLVNDVYKRFVKPDATDAEFVRVGRWSTVVILASGGIATFSISTIPGAWKFILLMTAGTGGVYILRWYWWRVNAWAEIVSMLAGFGVGLALFLKGQGILHRLGYSFAPESDKEFAALLILGTAATTLAWVATAFLTSPEPMETLQKFYHRVRPGGPGWGPVAAACPDVKPDAGFGLLFVQWGLGCVLVLGALFGIGELILGRTGEGVGGLAAAAVSGAALWRLMEAGAAADRRI